MAVIGRIGNDWAGDVLCHALQNEGAAIEAYSKRVL